MSQERKRLVDRVRWYVKGFMPPAFVEALGGVGPAVKAGVRFVEELGLPVDEEAVPRVLSAGFRLVEASAGVH